MKLIPFADGASTSIGTLTIESDPDRVALYGNLDLTHDQQGLAHARMLKVLVDQVVQQLEAETELPQAVRPAGVEKVVKNPFS